MIDRAGIDPHCAALQTGYDATKLRKLKRWRALQSTNA
jgi:hypothetical protein